MFEKHTAAKILPVGILDPLAQHALVTLIESELQILQPDHQADGLGPASFVAKERLEMILERGPVDGVGEFDERMGGIDDVK